MLPAIWRYLKEKKKGLFENPFLQYLLRGLFVRQRTLILHNAAIVVIAAIFALLWTFYVEGSGLVLQREQNYFFSQSISGFVVMVPYWVATFSIVNIVIAGFIRRVHEDYSLYLLYFTEVVLGVHFIALVMYLVRYQII